MDKETFLDCSIKTDEEILVFSGPLTPQELQTIHNQYLNHDITSLPTPCTLKTFQLDEEALVFSGTSLIEHHVVQLYPLNIQLLETSVIKIQKTIRMWLLKTSFKQLIYYTRLIQLKYKLKLKLKSIEKRDKIIKTQCLWKRYVCLKRFRNLKKCIVLIQSICKMKKERRLFIELKYSTVFIQSIFKMKKDRRLFLEIKHSIVVIQSMIKMKIQKRLFLEIKHSIVVIQSMFKMYIQKKKYSNILECILKIQWFWRENIRKQSTINSIIPENHLIIAPKVNHNMTEVSESINNISQSIKDLSSKCAKELSTMSIEEKKRILNEIRFKKNLLESKINQSSNLNQNQSLSLIKTFQNQPNGSLLKRKLQFIDINNNKIIEKNSINQDDSNQENEEPKQNLIKQIDPIKSNNNQENIKPTLHQSIPIIKRYTQTYPLKELAKQDQIDLAQITKLNTLKNRNRLIQLEIQSIKINEPKPTSPKPFIKPFTKTYQPKEQDDVFILPKRIKWCEKLYEINDEMTSDMNGDGAFKGEGNGMKSSCLKRMNQSFNILSSPQLKMIRVPVQRFVYPQNKRMKS